MSNIKERYISRYFRLRLPVKVARYEIIEGQKRVVQGHSIRFDQGVYETSNEDEIAFLDQYIEDNGDFTVMKVDKDAIAERTDALKTLEERNAELETELADAKAEGSKVDRTTPDGDGDTLDSLSADALRAKCTELGVSKLGNKVAMVERINNAKTVPADGEY